LVGLIWKRAMRFAKRLDPKLRSTVNAFNLKIGWLGLAAA